MKSLPIIVLLIGWLVAGASAQASDPNDRLSEQWNRLLRGCDEAGARTEVSRLRPEVAKSEEYNLARDIFFGHGCSEDELKDAIARDNQPLPATCGPQLTMELRQRIERTNPSTEPWIKMRALEKALQLAGCLPPSPRPQTTDCMPTFGGGFTCTTR